MKTYHDFLKLKLVREAVEDFEGEFEQEYDQEYYSGSGLWYDHEHGYYPQKDTIEFEKTDVESGELVPELVKYFDAEILAAGIGLKTLKYFPSDYVGHLNVYDNELTNLEHCTKKNK